MHTGSLVEQNSFRTKKNNFHLRMINKRINYIKILGFKWIEHVENLFEYEIKASQ
jgi:hypothetical protein